LTFGKMTYHPQDPVPKGEMLINEGKKRGQKKEWMNKEGSFKSEQLRGNNNIQKILIYWMKIHTGSEMELKHLSVDFLSALHNKHTNWKH
jgi:hypothetical protein